MQYLPRLDGAVFKSGVPRARPLAAGCKVCHRNFAATAAPRSQRCRHARSPRFRIRPRSLATGYRPSRRFPLKGFHATLVHAVPARPLIYLQLG